MGEWEVSDRRERVYTGPASVSGAELVRQVHQALSEWRELAGQPTTAEVPAGAVVVSAVGGVLTVRVEVSERHPDGGDSHG